MYPRVRSSLRHSTRPRTTLTSPFDSTIVAAEVSLVDSCSTDSTYSTFGVAGALYLSEVMVRQNATRLTEAFLRRSVMKPVCHYPQWLGTKRCRPAEGRSRLTYFGHCLDYGQWWRLDRSDASPHGEWDYRELSTGPVVTAPLAPVFVRQ